MNSYLKNVFSYQMKNGLEEKDSLEKNLEYIISKLKKIYINCDNLEEILSNINDIFSILFLEIDYSVEICNAVLEYLNLNDNLSVISDDQAIKLFLELMQNITSSSITRLNYCKNLIDYYYRIIENKSLIYNPSFIKYNNTITEQTKNEMLSLIPKVK